MDLPKIAECPVCLELFTEPKVLGCGHCFCKKCINAAPRGIGFTLQPKVTCPECRQESSVPAGGFPTNYRLLDIVSNLESAGFRNTKDCGGCGRKTPKAELFSCTTCQAEVGNAEEVIICSLCFMNAHKAHDFVRYNKATQRDVDEARKKINEDRVLTRVRVDMVRDKLDEMTQEVMQALEARTPKHGEIDTELEGALRADASRDDIEAKVNQSEQHATETAKIVVNMKILIHHLGRQLKECVEKKGEEPSAATAMPAADQPSTSAAAARPPRESTSSGAVTAWEHYFDHFGGGEDWFPYSSYTPTRLASEQWVDAAAGNASPPSRANYSTPTLYIPPTPIPVRASPAYLSPSSPPRDNSSTPVLRSRQATPARVLLSRRFEEVIDEERRDRALEQIPLPDGAASSSGTAARAEGWIRVNTTQRFPRAETRPGPGRSSVMLISSDEEDFNARARATPKVRAILKRPRRDSGN